MKKIAKTLSKFLFLGALGFLFSNVALGQNKGNQTAKANEALGTAFVEQALNAKTQDALVSILTKIVSPDYIQHNAVAPPGRNGLIAFIGAIGQSFPDGKATLLDVFATQDKVVARYNFKGTLTGQLFMGAPATNGQKADFDIIDIWTVKNGQLYEHWDSIDWVRVFAQLGIKEIPSTFVQLSSQPTKR